MKVIWNIKVDTAFICFLCIWNHFVNWIWCRHQNGTPRLWPIYIKQSGWLHVEMSLTSWTVGCREAGRQCLLYRCAKWRQQEVEEVTELTVLGRQDRPHGPNPGPGSDPALLPAVSKSRRTQCLQGQEVAFSITSPKKKNTVLYIKAQNVPELNKSVGLDHYIPVILVARNEVNCLFYSYRFSRCFCCSGLQMKNSKPSVTEHWRSPVLCDVFSSGAAWRVH